MSIMQLVHAMETYSLTCVLLALPVSLATSLVKRKCPKRFKKFFTFVPFFLGMLAFGILRFAQTKSFALPYSEIAADGFRCGGAATVYYVLYEQFLRKRKLDVPTSPTLLALIGVLENYIPEDRREQVAKLILEQVSPSCEESLASAQVRRILEQSASSFHDDQQTASLARLIVQIVQKV